MKDHIRHLVTKPGDRHYWQPSAALRRAGFAPRRLDDDLASASKQAMQINMQVDTWREGRQADADIAVAGKQRRPVRRPAQGAGSLNALISDYKKSARYTDLRPSTKRQYDWCLRGIAAEFGHYSASAVSPAQIESFYTNLAGRDAAHAARANATLRVLRLLFNASHHPFPRIRVKTPCPTTPQLWTQADVEQFVRTANKLGRDSIGLAVELNYWLGQRQADILALTTSQIDTAAQTITLTQAKTGARVCIPLTPGLIFAITRAAKASPGPRQPLLACETTALAWQASHFRAEFARIRAHAARTLPHMATLQFLHLRHSAITRMAEAGCTIPEIAAVSGHSLSQTNAILERYLVRSAPLAASAIARRIEKEGGDAH